MKKLINDKIFKINDSAEIRCSWFKTAGFRHEAKLYVNDIFQCSAKVCYINRTWESFEYESVIHDLLRKSKLFTPEEIKNLLSQWQKSNMAEVNANFGFLAGVMKLGELLAEGQRAQNDWKRRILTAGLGDAVDMPEDWDKLPEDEKEKRLNNVIEHFNK